MLPAFLMACTLSACTSQTIEIQPAAVTLDGPGATQRVIVLLKRGNDIVGDGTVNADLISANPKIVRVDAAGVLHAVGDGETVVTTEQDGEFAIVKVKVQNTKKPHDVSFAIHVIPILTRLGCNSGACHGALAGKGGLKQSLRGYDPDTDHFVLTRQANARRVNRQEPARSLFLLKPTLALPHGGGMKLEVKSPEFSMLANWIANGAPGIATQDTKLTRIEAFPPNAVLEPKDTLQVIVRAWYSDGRSEDVTRLAKYSSTEDLVAGVDDLGAVKVTGHGEAAIVVLFGNQVALVRVASPFANDIHSKVFATSPRHNFIDTLVLKKLEAIKLPPSPQCSDHEFIRRAHLDAIGVLPTPEEVRKFTQDTRPDRRARLIDALLERPEYVDYWSYKWADLLLISSRKLPQPAMRSFAHFVRQSVAANTPWDQFAREILTARGNNLRNGQVNYFLLHKDITDLTESTAVTFLGMSITCCRCHNHPMEKWTQDQYWSLANLFAQVAIKNGDRTGEFSVQSAGQGDILHPRRGIAMPPTPLDGKPIAPGKDRREYFADWLTAPDNPYFAKALVNRIWRNFMGRGLVEAEDDLRQTNPSSNEELLDALARDFAKNKYDTKKLVRTIMLSAAYQRSSSAVAGNKNDDRFYSRYIIRRLPAEVVLDAYSDIAKIPTEFSKVAVGSSGGATATPDYPLGTRALQLPDTQLVSQFLDAFGRPERGQTCACERGQESSVTQALHLNNGQTLNDKLRNKKSRVEEWVTEKVNDDDAIRRVYVLALSRIPTDAEFARFRKLLAEAANDPQVSRREAIEDLFWSVLTSREFLFNR